jgi:hypothetical protein
MFYKLVQDYAEIIAHYAVTDFRQFGNAASLVAHIELIDHSVLHIKDYLFIDGTRKYSFHWQDAAGQLRMRWDNSPTIRACSHFLIINIRLKRSCQHTKEIYPTSLKLFVKPCLHR